jgi:hypothetical protein
MKPAGVGEKSFVSTIETTRLNAKNDGREFSLADDVDWTRPEVPAWLRRMDMAIRYKHIDVQNELSNAPSWVKALMRTQKYSSPGQIYQAAIDYGDYGDKYKRLSESNYMDYNEVKQQYDTFGNQFAHLNQHAQAVIAANHDALGFHTPNSTVRGILEGTVPESERYRSGDVGTANDQGVWRNQFYADQSDIIANEYTNMTWTSTLRTDTHNRRVGGVGNSKHKKGISFDAVGPDAQRLRRDIDSGKVKGLDYYIGPNYTHVHFDITGPVSVAGQQTEPQPEAETTGGTTPQMDLLFTTATGGIPVYRGRDGNHYEINTLVSPWPRKISKRSLEAYEADAPEGYKPQAYLGGNQ